MVIFDHENLEVYRVACEYADAIAAKLERGNAHVRDQLRRESDSIISSVADSEFQPAEKARFYRIALRSCTESAATLHTCLSAAELVAALETVEEAGKLLEREVEMLTRLVRNTVQRDGPRSRPGPGPGPGPPAIEDSP
jgi:four helix bundle protein